MISPSLPGTVRMQDVRHIVTVEARMQTVKG